RIAAALAPDADEIHETVLVVAANELRDVALAARDRLLLAPGLQVVQIQVSPVVALGEPDHFARARQVAPVDRAVARLEKRLRFFLEDLADRAGRRVGHAQLLAAVIARGRDERDRRPVGAPLHVAPLAAAA